MKQHELCKALLLALPRDVRLFTNATGAYRAGGRFIRHGLVVGSADLIGWTVVRYGGVRCGIFTALELKRGAADKPTAEQRLFLDAVNKAGGIAGVVWDVEQAIDFINARRKGYENGAT